MPLTLAATATPQIYTLSLHDALPILTVRTIYRDLDALRDAALPVRADRGRGGGYALEKSYTLPPPDRKSTRLNSSHGYISYALSCLKKKNSINHQIATGALTRPKSHA